MNPILIIFLLACSVISGVDGYFEAHGATEPLWWFWSTLVLMNVLIFVWYHRDSEAHSYRRSRWLNIGMISLAPIVIPYYVVRRSPAGKRVAAFLKTLAFFALALIVSTVASLVGAWF